MGASPTRLSSTDLYVRSVIIESAEGNTGTLYVADSELKATSVNRHVLYSAGDSMTLASSPYADLDANLNLYDIWVHGTDVGDSFVVSYVNYEQELD